MSVEILNLGEEVNTKKFGKITMYELSLEDLQLCAKELAMLLMNLDVEEMKANNMAALAKLLASPQLVSCIYALVKSSARKPDLDFAGTGLSDVLKMAVGFAKVNNLKEIKELFFALVGKEVRELKAKD